MAFVAPMLLWTTHNVGNFIQNVRGEKTTEKQKRVHEKLEKEASGLSGKLDGHTKRAYSVAARLMTGDGHLERMSEARLQRALKYNSIYHSMGHAVVAKREKKLKDPNFKPATGGLFGEVQRGA
uniref:Uncharacterized protein n=1 Tax=Vitrella brassicaformis TaxID=1169539 RepID=A0A7S1PCY4_9ALVE|mmetsp:Transcript_53054/g.133528  ORF Transcript_53054/g.133528 Transcript_53054/m.133528 type:complete len:124 (+) Transcript_53054:158-529(+)